MDEPREYHVLTRKGDALADVDRALRDLGSAKSAGLHRSFFVSRANQTVVMAISGDSPIANALRAQKGWLEPGTAGNLQ